MFCLSLRSSAWSQSVLLVVIHNICICQFVANFDEASPEEIVGKRDVLATLHPGAFPKGNYDLQPP